MTVQIHRLFAAKEITDDQLDMVFQAIDHIRLYDADIVEELATIEAVTTMPVGGAWGMLSYELPIDKGELVLAQDTFGSVEGLSATIYHELVHVRQRWSGRWQLPSVQAELAAHTAEIRYWMYLYPHGLTSTDEHVRELNRKLGEYRMGRLEPIVRKINWWMPEGKAADE